MNEQTISIGLGFSGDGIAVCISSNAGDQHTVKAFRSSDKPGIQQLSDWISDDLLSNFSIDELNRSKIWIFHRDEPFAQKIMEATQQQLNPELDWEASAVKGNPSTLKGLVFALVLEDRVQVNNRELFENLAKWITPLEASDRGEWHLSPQVQAIFYGFGECEYRLLFCPPYDNSWYS